jgi:biopolymer transport protein ExbB
MMKRENRSQEVAIVQSDRAPGCFFWGFLILLFVILVNAGDVHAWWDAKWQYRKRVVLDTSSQGADVKERVNDLSILVRLHPGNFTFENANNDGSDIRFVSADDKTLLKSHVERYDTKEGMGYLWVRIPKLPVSSGQDYIWLYYGNSNAAKDQETGGTYDTPQLMVMHLSEKDGMPRDATSYNNHAKEFTGKLDIAGPIGGAASFRGDGEKMVVAKSPSLNPSKGLTFSAWIKLARSQENTRLLSWDDGKQSILIVIEGTGFYGSFADQKSKTIVGKTTNLPLQRWVHIAVTAEPGKNVVLYVNGDEKASQKLQGGVPEPQADVSIGASQQGKNPFVGDIDEVKMAGIARSPAWIRASAIGEGPETPLIMYGEEEASSGGGENLTIHLLVVTARAITLDGWLIIGIIIIMIGITWVLFFNKMSALRRTKKDNTAFMEAFSSSTDVRTMENQADEFAESPLFRIYSLGMKELLRRLANTDGTCKTASGNTIAAFKTILSKASLQESKKNTAGLIFFTSSISGGPFLGLFGTVWGVINTFAGVAEAGEANLAAIAPGVASALACTLMGLMLAIPALFQYSYLAAEIKNITADTNVFMGEFTTRVEDEYGGKA